MSADTKVVRSILRLVAFGCIIVAGALLAGDLFLVLSKDAKGRNFALALEVVGMLAGLVLMFKSSSLARRVTQDYYEEEELGDENDK